MTYRAFTLRRGTPLTLKGPVTRRTPCSRCLRTMTRLPRKRPARRITTVPGVRDWRTLAGRTDLRAWSHSQYRCPQAPQFWLYCVRSKFGGRIRELYSISLLLYAPRHKVLPPLLSARGVSSRTYLLGHSGVVSRVVFAGLLGVVRYRPLALGKLLRGGLVRHVELCVVSLKP